MFGRGLHGSIQTRRRFLQSAASPVALLLPGWKSFSQHEEEMKTERFDVIIVGGSYAGLAAGMGLGRALRRVLIVDSGLPANRFTPESHNFLTQDGQIPSEILKTAGEQVDRYPSVTRISSEVVGARRNGHSFSISLATGQVYEAYALVFATGIVDVIPSISGLAECWGKSVLHCPYCHGFEVRGVKTGILGNGDYAFEFGSLISNWTADLTIYTNGVSTLTREQTQKLRAHNIMVVEDAIEMFDHANGYIERIVFSNGSMTPVKAMYIRPAFRQHCELPGLLGCEMTDEGYIKVDGTQRTTIPGVYACGDSVTRIRTVANAVSTGTTTAITLNKDLIAQSF